MEGMAEGRQTPRFGIKDPTDNAKKQLVTTAQQADLQHHKNPLRARQMLAGDLEQLAHR